MAQSKHRQQHAPDPSEDRIRRLHEAIKDARQAELSLREREERVQRLNDDIDRTITEWRAKQEELWAKFLVDERLGFDQARKVAIRSYRDTLSDYATEAKETFAMFLGCKDHADLLITVADIVTTNILAAGGKEDLALEFLEKLKKTKGYRVDLTSGLVRKSKKQT